MANGEDTAASIADELELTFEPLDGDEETDIEDLDELDDDKDLEDLEDGDDEDDIDDGEDVDTDDVDTDDESDDEEDTDIDDEDGDSDGEDGDDEPPSVVESVITSLGYEFSDEELEGLEDSEEGITKLVELASQKASDDRFNQMVEATPNVKALYEFERAGGDPQQFIDAFYPEVNYSEVEVSEDDAEQQKAIIKESLKSKGLSKERVDRNLQAIEDSGNLLDEAKDSLNDLRTAQEEKKSQIKKDTQDAQDRAQKEAQEMWENVETAVREGKLPTVPVPKKQQNEFLEFIQVNPETGMSKRDEAIANMSIEEQLALDAIVFHGLDALDDIVERKASSKTNKTLRERLKSQKKRAKSSSQDPDLEVDSADVDDLQFRIDA